MRSKLFVPATKPELFPKALASGADAVCYDLEDAVPYDRKSEARAGLRDYFQQTTKAFGPLEIVRINGARTPHFLADLEAVVWPRLYAIALPKVEDPEELHELDGVLSNLESARSFTRAVLVLPTIESPGGLRKVHAIASCSHRIAGLQAGFADLLEPLGIVWSHSFARSHVRLLLRLAAGEAGIPCFDAAFPNFKDSNSFAVAAEQARSMGFAGASCIHPSQVPIANQIFAPSASEIKNAERIIAAMDAARKTGSGVPVVDGRMVDAPFERAARLLLSRLPFRREEPKG
jgi:citrate lyase beta subunit